MTTRQQCEYILSAGYPWQKPFAASVLRQIEQCPERFPTIRQSECIHQTATTLRVWHKRLIKKQMGIE